MTMLATMTAPLALAPSAAAGAVLLGWNAPSKTRVGSSFPLRLSIEADQPLRMLSLTIGFDPRCLEVRRVMTGKPADADSKEVPLRGALASSGQLALALTPLAAGTLATIHLRAIGESPASFMQILAVRAVDAVGVEVPVAVPGVVPILILP
ncbi:MAG: hypothetical protein ABIT83_12575 [Massilia sp.]